MIDVAKAPELQRLSRARLVAQPTSDCQDLKEGAKDVCECY